MRRVADSGVRALQGRALLRRCHFDGTLLVGEVVALASTEPLPGSTDTDTPFTGGFAGLAFDGHGRLFHARPEDGAIDFVLWRRSSLIAPPGTVAEAFEFTGSPQVAAGARPQAPRALACDDRGLLYVADAPGLAVWLIDTWQHQVVRQVVLPAPPLDLAPAGGQVHALLEDGSVWRLDPCAAAQPLDWPRVAGARRLALGRVQGRRQPAWVLVAPGTADAMLHGLHDGLALPVPFATDLAFESPAGHGAAPAGDGDPVLILAGRPGEELRRLQLAAGATDVLPGLLAPHHDGCGIEWTPDGRVAYWTARGLRHAAPARGRYRSSGRLFALALDGEQPQTRWGRLQVEACVPAGTRIAFHAFTADELDAGDAVATVAGAELPVVSQAQWALRSEPAQALCRDPSMRPLAARVADGFAVYEAPVMAAPGRYLWLVFELEGTGRKTPRLRAARVEYPGHDLLGLLPRTLWREPAAREFLFRFLMPLAAMLDEWEAVADTRHRLLDARITPAAALPWLAQFVGLVLDPCWPENAQRRLILEAVRLFRTRGTLASLRRMLELLTDAEVVVIEQFRLRGGGVVGNPDSIASQAVLGAGYRVGGRIGTPPGVPAVDEAPPARFDDFAHRFTVTVVARLTEVQLACARRLIEHHKPAHTTFELCTVDSGFRAGVGAHIGLSTVLGRSGGFEPTISGAAALGAGTILGRPALVATPEVPS